MDAILHSFYNDRFKSNNVWEDRMGKRLLKHKDNTVSPVPKKILFCYKYWHPSYTEMPKIMNDITFLSRNA